jgi:serine/threonine-protein kinase
VVQGGTQQLYLRAMDSAEAKPVPGTEGAVAPFFSPDSQSLGYFTGGKLKKVSVSGGPAVTLCDVPGGTNRSASWGADNTIVFHYAGSGGLWRVSAAGGTPQRLTAFDSKKAEIAHWYPQFLPLGTAALFVAARESNIIASDGQIVVRSLQTGEQRDVVVGTRPTYAPTGQVIYAQGGTLMAVAFDARQLAATGPPIPVLEGVLGTNAGAAQYAISSTGSLVYAGGGLQAGARRLVWLDRKGAEQPLSAPPRSYRSPRLSTDGRRIAIANAESQIWMYDLVRETLTRLTFGINANTPLWTPDSKRIVFQSGGGPKFGMFWQPADGSGSAEQLTVDDHQHVDGSWSPDGQHLAFVEVSPTSGRDISVLNLADRKPQRFLHTQFNETAPQFSPDGGWLAYASDESGRSEIYVQPYPGPGGKFLISTEGGTEPIWGRNGEIFYRSGDKMMAVKTTTKPAFTPGNPTMLFEGRYVPTLQTMPNYDVTPDGQRFVMIKEDDQGTSSVQINVVLNWTEELKRLAPPKPQ